MHHKILMADDDAVFWIPELLSRSARSSGFAIDFALTPEQCWEAVATAAFDVILLDISFGSSDVSGLGLLPELRRSMPFIKIVMFSGMDDPQTRAYCQRQGAHAFVSKDKVSADFLWDEIERVLGSK